MNKFEIGDRVIYDGCPFIVQRYNKSKSGWLHNRSDINEQYMLHPLKWDKDYPYQNTWVSVELIKLDYQHYRNEKLNKLLDESKD